MSELEKGMFDKLNKPAPAEAEKPAAEATPASVEPVGGHGIAPLRPASAEAPPQQHGEVLVRSLRIRKDHTTQSALVGGLVAGNEVTIFETWTDGKDTWARIGDGQWAAMTYQGETYIKPK